MRRKNRIAFSFISTQSTYILAFNVIKEEEEANGGGKNTNEWALYCFIWTSTWVWMWKHKASSLQSVSCYCWKQFSSLLLLLPLLQPRHHLEVFTLHPLVNDVSLHFSRGEFTKRLSKRDEWKCQFLVNFFLSQKNFRWHLNDGMALKWLKAINRR